MGCHWAIWLRYKSQVRYHKALLAGALETWLPEKYLSYGYEPCWNYQIVCVTYGEHLLSFQV